MKRFSCFLTLFVLLLNLIASASVGNAADTYRDESSGMSFDIPDGWEITFPGDPVDAQLSPAADPKILVLFCSLDAYAESLKEYEQAGQEPPFDSRAAYDLLCNNKESAASAVGCSANEIKSVDFGENTYYYYSHTLRLEDYGATGNQPVTYFLRFENGFLYIFQFYGKMSSPYFDDVKHILADATYPHADTQDVVDARQSALWATLHPVNLILSLLITVTIYSLPIFIYRWCIRKYPVERKPAKIIAIIYGICAFIVMSLIQFVLSGKAAGSSILLWSWINYRVMIGGSDRRFKPTASTQSYDFAPPEYLEENFVQETETCETASDEAAPQEAAEQIPDCRSERNPAINYCRKCGARLPERNDDQYCAKCGAKIYE